MTSEKQTGSAMESCSFLSRVRAVPGRRRKVSCAQWPAGSSRSINQPATVDPHPFLSLIKPFLRASEVQNRDSLSNPAKSWTGFTGFFRINSIAKFAR